MKKPMKLLRNLLLGTFTMALWFGVNSQTVKAEEGVSIKPQEITIDYANQQLILEERGTRDAEIICEFGTRKTVTTGKGADRESRDICKFYATNIYDYESGLVIDLSSLKREKDNYIRLYGNYSEDPITIKIPAINTAVKATFDPVNGIVKMYDKEDKKDVMQFTSEKIEYRTVYSDWKQYIFYDDDDDYDSLSKYQKRGATLYFRLKAEAAQTLILTAPLPTSGDIEDADGDDIPVYVAFSFPGKEVKVAIPQLPSAPKVAVDYDKQAFALPKGSEYRVVTNRSDMKWKPAKKAVVQKITLADLADQYGECNGSTLEVRIAKTEKKPASKIFQLRIVRPDAPSVKSINANTSMAVNKQSIDKNCLKDQFGSDALVAEYAFNAKKKQYTGVRFKSSLDEAYEICAVSGGGEPSPTVAGVHTIKAIGESKSSAAVTTISVSQLREGSTVYIRRKASQKTQQLSSSWSVFGVVSYPDEAPEY